MHGRWMDDQARQPVAERERERERERLTDWPGLSPFYCFVYHPFLSRTLGEESGRGGGRSLSQSPLLLRIEMEEEEEEGEGGGGGEVRTYRQLWLIDRLH